MLARLYEGAVWAAENKPCRGAVLYEGSPGRGVAMDLFQRLSQTFHDDLHFDLTWWRFKYLSHPRIAHEAVEVAAEADLLALALPESRPLPAPIKSWLEEWSARRRRVKGGQTGALVALAKPLEPRESDEAFDDSFLRSLAERARVDFLTIPSPGAARSLSDLVHHEPPRLPVALPHMPEGDTHFRSLGWGIDE